MVKTKAIFLLPTSYLSNMNPVQSVVDYCYHLMSAELGLFCCTGLVVLLVILLKDFAQHLKTWGNFHRSSMPSSLCCLSKTFIIPLVFLILSLL